MIGGSGMTNKGEKFEGFSREVWAKDVMEFLAENPDLTQEEKDLAIADLHFWENSREWNLNYGCFR